MTTNVLKKEFSKLVGILARLFHKNGKEEKSAVHKEILRDVKMIKSDPKSAEIIFCAAYKEAEKGTVFAAKLMENVGQCRIERSKRARCPVKKYTYLLDARRFFAVALQECPEEDKAEYKEKLTKILKTYQKEQWG